MNDPRETVTKRRRRGMQELSGKRIGSGRYFGEWNYVSTPKGQPEAMDNKTKQKGISQVMTEA